MTISLPIDDFLFSLFPLKTMEPEAIQAYLQEFYAGLDEQIEVRVEGERLHIVFPEPEQDGKRFRELLRLGQSGNFVKARPIAEQLVQDYPAVSEYHRLLGQVYAELEEEDKAIDALIDALRLDPANVDALLMMGNVFSEFKNDLSTAMQYYQQVLKRDPENFYALTNIGTKLVQAVRYDEAASYLDQALTVKPDFPLAHYSKALLHYHQARFAEAFEAGQQALAHHKEDDTLSRNCHQLIVRSAQALAEKFDAKKVINQFCEQLSAQCGLPVRIEADEKISTAAKIEFATLGMGGINPDKQNYQVPSLARKMSGYQALAYYYVSWALTMPEHLGDLQLPFEKEYELALRLTT